MTTNKPPVRLLLIEDSPTDAILFRTLVAEVVDVSITVEHSDTLGGGMEKISAHEFDAVVLDLNLPDSAGLATFERLRSASPDMPVVILTGDDDRSLSNKALQKGADNYLVKDSADGNRIAISVLSAIRNHRRGIHSFSPTSMSRANE